LSFEKKPPTQVKNKKLNTASTLKSKNQLPLKASRNKENKENEIRRQTFNVPKKDSASRNLFGSAASKSNRATTRNNNSEPLADPEKPRVYLKRKSVTQVLLSK